MSERGRIWLPTIIDITILHQKIVQQTGGSADVRDMGLVSSALMRAEASFGGEDLYPGIIDKAAVICHGLVMNHGFVDGNKRIGVTAMLLILRRNDVLLAYTQNELVEFGLNIAKGKLDVQKIKDWIVRHIE